MRAPQPLDPPIQRALDRIAAYQLHQEGQCARGCEFCMSIVAENEPVCDAPCCDGENHCPRHCILGQPF